MTKAELFRKLPADMRASVEAQLAALPARGRGNKFNAQACYTELFPILRGIRFGSKVERDYGLILAARQLAGEITGLRCHPTFHLGPARISYKADFGCFENGMAIAIEVKGVMTERFRMVCRLWAVHGPCELRVVRRCRGQGMKVVQAIACGERV